MEKSFLMHTPYPESDIDPDELFYENGEESQVMYVDEMYPDEWYDEVEGEESPLQYPPTRPVQVSSLPPFAAIFISLFLMGVFLNYSFQKMSTAELPELQDSLPSPALQEAELPANSSRTNGISPVFTPEVQYWANDILAWAQQWELDPNLVATVMQIESCGHPTVRSSAGANGLFQVMPYHFADGEDPFNPATNASRGLDYLTRSLSARNGDILYGLAGYNAGITGASRGQALWPAETQRYTYWGMGIYEDAANGRDNSSRLEEWLSSGGASLCRRAAEALGLR